MTSALKKQSAREKAKKRDSLCGDGMHGTKLALCMGHLSHDFNHTPAFSFTGGDWHPGIGGTTCRRCSGQGLAGALHPGLARGGFYAGCLTDYLCRSSPFLCQRWLIEWFSVSRDFIGWFTVGVVLFLALILWVRGIALGRRPPEYRVICSRFDLGVAAFFLLLLIKLLVLIKTNIQLRDPVAELHLFAFLGSWRWA